MSAGAPQILVAEDDPDHAELIRRSLRADGLPAPRFVTDGERALELLLDEPSWHPDVVVLDLRMARMGGMQLLSALQALPMEPALIVLSTSEAPYDIALSRQLGADRYLVKPGGFLELGSVIRALCPLAAPGAPDP